MKISANVNLQKEGMLKLSLHFHYGLTNVMFLPPLSPKCLFKESRWMTNTSGLQWTATLCLKEIPFETDVNVSQKTTLLLLHFHPPPHCVSGVR